jgi:hypothetical protein
MASQHINVTAGAFFRTFLASGAILELEGIEQAIFQGLDDSLVLAEQPAFFAIEAETATDAAPAFGHYLIGA